MSLSRKNKVWGVAESLLGRLAKKRLSKAREQKPTKLSIDPLEERQLLSLTVATTDNVLVNPEWQDIRGDVSVDSNGSGDVVVAWTGADRLLNPDYNPEIDLPCEQYLLENGAELEKLKAKGKENSFVPQYVEDLNVYARYLTNEVQEIAIPAELVPGAQTEGGKATAGSFELVYNAFESQRFSIYFSNFATDQSEEEHYGAAGDSIACFNLGFYVEGELNWILFKYDSNLLPTDNAQNLQDKIRSLPGGEYSDVVVTAHSETDFDIKFYGDAFEGENLSDVKVRSAYYDDVADLIAKIESVGFDVSDLKYSSVYQKLALKDLFGDNYLANIQAAIDAEGVGSVLEKLDRAQDALIDSISSGVVTTTSEVQTITKYSSKSGASLGIQVSADRFQTAKNIQEAFDAVAKSTLYAPITRGYRYDEATHRYAYDETPTSAYSSDEEYGAMQGKIAAIQVKVVPTSDSTNENQKFRIEFVGSSGLQNQDALIVSAASYSTRADGSTVQKSVVQRDENGYNYVGIAAAEDASASPTATTIKESSAAFRVNAPEVADFALDSDGCVVEDSEGYLIVNGTGRTAQSKPGVAMSSDGSFVVAWENETSGEYNASDIFARRFNVRGYVDENDAKALSVGFYDNGTADGKLGYADPDGAFVVDPYSMNANSNAYVQCVYPVADAFVVNASTNGRQTDPSVAGDSTGNFIVSWTYLAQDNSYYGGVYARQFDVEARPVTGDVTIASGQVGTNQYGPSTVAMSDSGFAVVLWNYNETLYQAVLEPKSDVFILDNEAIAGGDGTFAYGSSVSFDYNDRYAIAYSLETAYAAGDDQYPSDIDVYLVAYAIAAGEGEGEATGGTTDDAADDEVRVERKVSGTYSATAVELGLSAEANNVTVGYQGNPSVALDADGDVFIAYQGFGLDIQSVPAGPDVYYFGDGKAIQLTYDDFEDNNLVYYHKPIKRGTYVDYEDKNDDLIPFVKCALGWGYDKYGKFVEDAKTPVYDTTLYGYSDVDGYVKRFLAIAQKEGATMEQITRLNAVLEALLSPLRNNGSDVAFMNYGQTVYTAAADGLKAIDARGGVVSAYRDGSNASFYIAVPADYVASASIVLNIGRTTDRDSKNEEPATEAITLDLTGYYDGDTGFLTNPRGLIAAVSAALNGAAFVGGAEGESNSAFAVRDATFDAEFYKGTIGDVQGEGKLDLDLKNYWATIKIGDVDTTLELPVANYFVLEITAQDALHDTPLTIEYDVENSSIKLKNQAVDSVDYKDFASVYVERAGSVGTSQVNPVAESTGNGDILVAWTSQANMKPESRRDLYPAIGNSLAAQYAQIYVRAFTESTDNAGPVVTNVSLPNGTKVENGDTVTSAVKNVVVSFNENMTTVGDGTNRYNTLHAVDNPANWTLLRDGVEVPGAIASVSFGMNESQRFAKETVDENGVPVAEISEGALSYGVNRWEAVITFADGFELLDGSFELVCDAMVQDVARNALASQGYAADGSTAGLAGEDWSIRFGVIRLNEAQGFEYSDAFPRNNVIPENYVQYDETDEKDVYPYDASTATLEQKTRSNINDETSDYGPNSPTAVASNSNGDYVATWVDTLTFDQGDGTSIVRKTVWAKAYRALYVVDANGVRQQIVDQTDPDSTVTVKVFESEYLADNKTGEIVKGSEPAYADPRQASVAIDDKGDFVVVWDMLDLTESGDGSRDVYIRKFAFNGGAKKINGSTEMLRVNVESDEDQQYASVATDSDGDVVVVWESYKQDGDGWGIYGRRFMSDGYSYGYANTVQKLTFSRAADVVGDALILSGRTPTAADGTPGFAFATDPIQLTVETKTNATRVKDALVDALGVGEKDLDVVVSAVGEISIEFKGEYTGRSFGTLQATTTSKLDVNVEKSQTGVPGVEFLVNETTENHQRFASIGMARDGGFVVSWTSWGQDGDAATEGNIYARKFVSNHLVSQRSGSVEEMPIMPDGTVANVITTDEVEAHELSGGEGYEGVCLVAIGEADAQGEVDAASIGSGSLLTTGLHVLTAAHVVCGEDGTPVDPTEEDVYCTFETKDGVYSIRVVDIQVHETYQGDPSANQVDLAILTLEKAAPSNVVGYDIYEGSSELGRETTFVGYGTYGRVDWNEETAAARPVGVKHYGQNVFELTGAEFQDADNPNVLVADFDDGTAANDYFGSYYGIRDRGLGDREASPAQGDSGGPALLDGKIAGVCSYGTATGDDAIVNPGGFFVYVRVSAYADWINDVVMSGLGGEFLVNTDSAIVYEAVEDEEGGGTAADDEGAPIVSNWQEGRQLWSSVAMDASGNFVVTWTGYNQDGNGDAITGPSRFGLGGVFARSFASDPKTARIVGGEVFQVNQTTAYDQVRSNVAVADNGEFVVVYESYQDPSTDEKSDEVDGFGIYARRFKLTVDEFAVGGDGTTGGGTTDATDEETVAYALLQEPVGSEFRVNWIKADQTVDEDQLGASVAVDANGDMVFVWTDMNDPTTPIDLQMKVVSLVETRSVALPEDETPPYVVRANAVYSNAASDWNQVSLYSNIVTFASGNGPTSLVYSFSEYMTTAQMQQKVKRAKKENDPSILNEIADDIYLYSNAVEAEENVKSKSVLNIGNWTLTCDGKTVTTDYIADFAYGFNAATERSGNSEYATNSYELFITFRDGLVLPDGLYVLTLNDKVCDVASNNLDGDYDGESGGAFTVRFRIGASSAGLEDDERIPSSDEGAFAAEGFDRGSPVVAGNSDGYVIVAESQRLFLIDGSDDGGTTGGTTGGGTTEGETTSAGRGFYETVTIDGSIYRVESDIVIRRYDANGTPQGVETRVNAYSAGNQLDPDVAVSEGGSYVVSWVGESSKALNGVCARFYPGGVVAPTQIQVAGQKGVRCWDVDVAINEATGLVLISWIQGSEYQNGDDKVWGRFYDLNGKERSDAFEIADDPNASITEFDVATAFVDGEIRYAIAWSVMDPATKSNNVYQKSFSAVRSTGSDFIATGFGETTRVNDTVVQGQYAPQIEMIQEGPRVGDYYVVWTSDQNLGKGADIYARAYNADGTSQTFLGTTGEAKVNVTDAHRQYQPSLAASSEGVVFVWTSFDAEEYNYDKLGKVDLHDDGVCGRVFNAAGEPINVASKYYAYGEIVGRGEGEFNVNSTTAGRQECPSVEILPWSVASNGLLEPKFVVVWQGPSVELAATGELTPGGTEEGGDTTGGGTGGGTTAEGEEGEYYYGCFDVFYKVIGGSSLTLTGEEPDVATTRYAVSNDEKSGSDGFYRPNVTIVDAPIAENAAFESDATVLTIDGTASDDLLIVVANENGIVSATLNGVAVNISTGVERVVFKGGNGSDKVDYRFEGAASAIVSSAAKSFAVSGAVSFLATNVEAVDATASGGELRIDATTAYSDVKIAPRSATLAANGFAFVANGFAKTTAVGSATSTVALIGSAGADAFVANGESATLTGADFATTVFGFGTARAVGGDGADSAVVENVSKATALDGGLVATASSTTIVALGFETVEAKGVGSATADLYGSRGDDSIVADATKTEMVYASGATLKATGFATANVFGNGGVDRASLFAGNGANVFEGWATKASLTNGSFARNLNGFANVAVYGSEDGTLDAILNDSIGDDAFVAENDSLTQSIDGSNLYSAIAVDRVKVRRSVGKGNDSLTRADEIDFVFETENWDF